ncbi:alpha/beta hydrolase [Bradyrhizobium ontarionense]|uniref:Alpha/beta hydrolase n=1 Tax=Bradyrhizobium ontarionense TaxID=2898149 RepID=A0ABY3RB25_9BRAD|nr:alpha/beta hydrolase [Bradyrhizobium sp. A19]UFZ03978.1 alpha/beta hydrolase [Bradyrhizobium sp. A19]
MDVRVYFATNRQPLTADGTDQIMGFGSDLGPVNGLSVRYGRADIAVDLAARTYALVPGSVHVEPEQLIFPQGSGPVLGSDTIFGALRADMQAKARATIAFIHGFSNSFVDAIERAGWISAFYGLDANMFVFSWPSVASPFGVPLPYVDYQHDRKTAAASGPAVARTLRRLYDFVDTLPEGQRCNQSIHLVCHSMGVYVLRNALQALMQMPDPVAGATMSSGVSAMVRMGGAQPSLIGLRKTFDKVVLAAADEDADAFDDPAKLKYLPRTATSVTVYHSTKDWVLNTLSAGTKFNGPRLGNDGPENMGSISDKVTAIDCSDVTTFEQDPQEHQYYRIFPVVRDDIVQVLNGVPQNQVTNREPVASARYRIRPQADVAANASAAKPRVAKARVPKAPVPKAGAAKKKQAGGS